ncbi:hypothetical protein C8Q77DRAFT_645402 [Trametes polyzona]|nr:hypothetical protein C8Q77DRAFT_645402 [Trametes polyzona]
MTAKPAGYLSRLLLMARPGVTHRQRTTAAIRLKHTKTPEGLHGVARARVDESPSPTPSLFEREFSLAGKVTLVTGARRGLGLEGALALAEAGARSIYCIDVERAPGDDWTKAQDLVARMRRGRDDSALLEYIQGDVSDQESMWKIGQMIGDREGRMDVGFAAAGIAPPSVPSLNIPEELVQKVLDINLKGSLYTAQAVGRQMERFGNGGSIILVASIAGSVTVNLGMTPYEISKSGVHQLARGLACELAPKGIRVNTLSPGYFNTTMVDVLYKEKPEWVEYLVGGNPMKRMGQPHEVRGTVAWLASDASSFCTGIDIAVDGGHCAS